MDLLTTSRFEFLNDTVVIGRNRILVKRVFGQTAGSFGIATLVPAVSNKKLRIFGFMLASSSTFTFSFRSGSTALSGDLIFPASSILQLKFDPIGIVETAIGAAFGIGLSGTGIKVYSVLYGEI
ncbi:hypothetical protein C4588_07250 [Candidatus Parcubacteria bacterium]|nr:MAG: hypothetical protein C4588_07250 [Candidatus Parcubacteria bacterium]